MQNDLLVFILAWLATNTSQLVQLFAALVPVLALLVVGYAVHAIVQTRKGDKK